MNSRILAAFAALLCAACAATGADAPKPRASAPAAVADATPPKPKPSKDPNRIVCHEAQLIGTRLGATRICKTAAEWAAQEREARRAADDAKLDRGMSTPQRPE